MERLHGGVAALALLVLVTGCLGGVAGIPGTDTREPHDGTATPTPARDCVADHPPTTDPARAAVTPSPLPERPDELTRDRVLSYVEDYEVAYRRNLGLRENTETYEVFVTDASVREVEDGHVVDLEAKYWYNAGGPEPGTATATIIHADGPRYEVSYHVTDAGMRRSVADGGTPSPRAGEFVECWAAE